MKTKEKILAVAQTLFVEQGIDRTSTAQICKTVGIASGSLFVHFKTKQDLVDSIYLERKNTFLHAMQSALVPEKSVKENVLEISAVTIDYFLENFVDFEFLTQIENGQNISEKAKSLHQVSVEENKKIIVSWQKSGNLKASIDATLLTDIWWGMLGVFIRRLHRSQSRTNRADLDIIWEALRD